LIRALGCIVIAAFSIGAAVHYDALSQFLGGAFGAFLATYARNDKKKMRVIVVDAIHEHEKRLHK